MAMDLAPWLAQPIADPSQAYVSGFGHGAQVGAQQAEQRIRQQAMDMQAQQHAVELQQRAIEFSMKLDEQRQQAEELKAHQQMQYDLERQRIGEEAARTAMYGKWHTEDVARRTAYDQIRATNQQNILAEKKAQQAQNYEIQQKRVAAEADRTKMMGEHYTAETGRRTAVDQAKQDRMDAYQEAVGGGATTKELAEQFPDIVRGVVQMAIDETKNKQTPTLTTLQGSQGPVDVLTQPGRASQIVPKQTPRDAAKYAARLNGYKAEIASLQAQLLKHPSRDDATYTDAELAKVKGVNMEGVKDYRALAKHLNDVRGEMAKFRDAAPAAQSQPVRRWDPDTHSWFDPSKTNTSNMSSPMGAGGADYGGVNPVDFTSEPEYPEPDQDTEDMGPE